MGDRLIDALVTILVAVIGLATIAVILGRNSQTSNVLKAGGSSFAGILNAATNPGGGGSSLNLNTSGFGAF